MVVRWIRKALVLALAALGVQYGRMIARILFAELRPSRERLAPNRIPAGPLIVNGGTAPTPRGRATTTLEPHGAI
jgi:hypothetical protein